MSIEIYQTPLTEVESLTHFARRIFSETFLNSIDKENMKIYLDAQMSQEVFKQQLQSSQYFTFSVSSADQMIGYIQLHYNKNETYDGIPLELKRFYLDSRLHGQGVAGLMMEYCLQEVRKLKEPGVWLGVWENNFKALKFYNKWGFNEIASHDFVTGSETQRDLILARKV